MLPPLPRKFGMLWNVGALLHECGMLCNIGPAAARVRNVVESCRRCRAGVLIVVECCCAAARVWNVVECCGRCRVSAE